MTSYEDEAALETLLLESPDLLPGSDGSPLAVVRQLYVPQTGPVDLFAVSPTGGITVVECKLRANPEIRRSVIGQVLAYAAGLWRLSYEELDIAFTARAGRSMVDVLAQRASTDGGDFSPELFRAAVTRNLAAGSMRLVIAVDDITDELKRIVEFLNDRTQPDVEVVALELGYVRHAGVEIIAPTVYGQEAVRRKAPDSARSKWDEQSLLAAIQEYCSPTAAAVLTAVYEHARGHARWTHFYWGEGQHPSATAWFAAEGVKLPAWNIYAAPQGKTVFAINFDWIHQRGKGLPADVVERLAERMRQLPGVPALYADLAERNYAKRPSIPASALESPDATGIIIRALEEMLG
ncbi:hypothetical protein [Geodermatophilus sp. SYSU D00691]